MAPVTNSDVVVQISTGETATFDSNLLSDSGHFAVRVVELVNLESSAATFSLGGGPTRTLLAGERYVSERNVDTVLAVSGSIEVVFTV
jgi:hypothetical protein